MDPGVPTNEQDEALERTIETARRALVKAHAAGDRDGAREYDAAMAALIKKRSPEQIARMEARLPKLWGTGA